MTRSGTSFSVVATILLWGCQQDSAALTLVNGGHEPIEVEGLPAGMVTVAPGESTRIGGLKGTLRLTASNDAGKPTEESIQLHPGGEAVWRLAGEACFAEGDFSAYYTTVANRPATVRLVGTMGPEQPTYSSRNAVSTPSGYALPRSQGAHPVHALVQIPCAATESTALTQAWLEMILDEIQPK